MIRKMVILVILFAIFGCASQNPYSGMYPYKDHRVANSDSQKPEIDYSYEFILKDDNNNPVKDASIDYVITEKLDRNISLLDIDKGKMITDSSGKASKIFNQEKDRFKYTFFPNSLGKQFPRNYSITYKIEKQGFRPIINIDDISLSSTKTNQLKNEVLSKIIPPSQTIQDGLTFDVNRLRKQYNGSNIALLKNELIQEGIGTSDEDTLGGNWYDAKKLTELTRTKVKTIKDADAAKNVYALKLEDEWIGFSSSNSKKNSIELRLNANKKKFIIRDLGLKRRSYLGSNVFGVTVKVKEASEVQYTIKPINLGTSINVVKLNIDIPPDEFNKNDIGVLFICKPFRWNNCYITTSGGGKSPTIFSPSAYYHIVYNINVELYEIWIYNQKSGEIYLKQKMI